MRLIVGMSLVVLAGSAHAGDKPVNLLASVPATVAVSSTVANAAIVPEHLVDGDLKTAWNSRTGELDGAWIAFRVPADAKVTAIKLTAGFTHVDKKLGDLFAQNPRIKKVRVSRAGVTLGELTLDVTSRALQTFPVSAPGGDFQITVLAHEPGTKKAWREISVSELEVWGTTPAAVKPQRPAIRIGSLDANPVLSKAECLKALPARPAGRIVDSVELGLSADTTICRVDTAPSKGAVTVTLAAVRHRPRARLGAPITIALNVGPDGEHVHEGDVIVVRFPLTRTETALLVHVKSGLGGPYAHSETTTSTLYRATPAGLAEVLAFTSRSSRTIESRDSEECDLRAVQPGAALPKRLQVDCVESRDDYHNEDLDQRGTHEKSRTDVFVWDGKAYAP